MIEFKKLHTEAITPFRASEGAAGFDLFYSGEHADPVDLYPGKRHLFETGFACAIPQNWCGLIMPRSGWAIKDGRDKLAGLIDEDYRGEVGVILINHGSDVKTIMPGERIAQMIVVPYMKDSKEVMELSTTIRGENGYGSTGAL
jgi:dUTP pyrophosphatase